MKKLLLLIAVVLVILFQSCKDIPFPVDLFHTLNGQKDTAIVTTFVTGLNAPRGLKFGPDGYLYVGEAGLGGDNSTQGQCDQVIPPVGPYLGGYTARILKINSSGIVTVVVDSLPSAQNAVGDRIGVNDIAFMNNNLYALLMGGGCSHGHSDYPASLIKVNANKTWSIVADLSNYQANNPVAHPEEDDFEPDGSWYSLITVDGNFFAMEANHGELVKITLNGDVSRILDFSAIYGHIVPTVVAFHNNFYVGNLNTFPVVSGSSNIYKVTKDGWPQIWASGFSTILGVVFDKNSNLYVLEATTADGPPTPNTGKIIKIFPTGKKEILVDNLTFATGITIGPDDVLYVSNKGFGPPIPGYGEILRIQIMKK